MKKTSEPGKTRWHRLLGRLLEELLKPTGVLVYTEFPVMAGSPQADILLLRKQHGEWTPEQLRFLPDGIRDSRAGHILIEFKYTESVTKETFRQISGYEYFYRQSSNLSQKEVQAFVLSSKTPQNASLNTFGYFPTEVKGVYRHDFWMLEKIPLLCLNSLSDEPHNAFVKCFASRKKEKLAAFDALKRQGFKMLRAQIQWLVEGLLYFWFSEKGEYMETLELTPEKVIEMGKKWADLILSGLSTEDRLKGLEPEEVLSRYKPEEVLSRYRPEEVLSRYKPEEVLSRYKPEDRLKGLDPRDRLNGLSEEEIEAYLHQIRTNKN
ncbi:MAG: hypothetical protein V2I97_01825 [Desulfococcaceae bacterium]|jgi:hypothetical protein|nr:hypothetical protein [Desulfococcaceae bacterium]